ncbi:hypothetical protein BVRB_041540, partial [Beta vulgaris subsp. vulgaris]
IKQAVVYRVALWVIGEYANDSRAIGNSWFFGHWRS